MPPIALNAPVGSIDLSAEGHAIWPCGHCLPWHLEVLRDPQTGEVFAREWHAVDCPLLALLAAAEILLGPHEPHRSTTIRSRLASAGDTVGQDLHTWAGYGV